MSARVRTGLDRLAAGEPEVVRLVGGRRVGLVAHPASVDARLVHARDVLRAAGADLRVLFGPEHGYGGEAQDMIGVAGAVDLELGVPIHSLYGPTEAHLRPRREWLEGLDVVVVDLQDVGSRYYTFVWTACIVLVEAARAGVQTVVLDRPNPLGGAVVEGAPQRPGYRSFVGLYDVAVRHGMTIGELCVMARELEGLDAASLEVVRMAGWAREMLFEDTGLPWVFPSPNMPTVDTAFVYPGGCLLEATNLSEGRGTTKPFEVWGAPFVDGKRLSRAVDVEGAVLRPLTFQATFHKHAGAVSGGVAVHVTDRARFRAYEAYLRWIAEVYAQQAGFQWRTEPYEFVADRPAIDLLTGGPEYREAVEAGRGLDGVLTQESTGAQAFTKHRHPWLLYRGQDPPR